MNARAHSQVTIADLRRRIHAIAYGPLGWDEEQYRDWLLDTHDANSLFCLDYHETAAVLADLESFVPVNDLSGNSPAYLFARDYRKRIAAWNAELFTRGALAGIASAESGCPPDEKSIRNIAGMMWELCKPRGSKQYPDYNPADYARGVIRRVIGSDRIATADHAAAMIRMLRTRGQRQGLPYARQSRGGGRGSV